MRDSRLTAQPLAGPSLQFSLLAPALLLFLVFLVATPFGSHRPYGLDPPSVPGSFLSEPPKDGLLISIPSDGKLFIDARWFSATAFSAKMLEYGQKHPPARAILRADRSLPFSVIRSALRGAQLSGAHRVFLMTFEGRPIELLAKAPPNPGVQWTRFARH